jgi:hypothetical protein
MTINVTGTRIGADDNPTVFNDRKLKDLVDDGEASDVRLVIAIEELVT